MREESAKPYIPSRYEGVDTLDYETRLAVMAALASLYLRHYDSYFRGWRIL